MQGLSTSENKCITASPRFAILQALGKLSAQAEEVGAANLGDLDGFIKDMSEEVRKLRQVRCAR